MSLLKAAIGKRRQFFEIQDFSWCPKAVRDGVTDYLSFSLRLVPLYDPAKPWIERMHAHSPEGWIDLCAGAGGGSLPLHKFFPKIPLLLTDLYPQQTVSKLPNVTFFREPVDARSVPAGMKGFRTLFTSFHHLPDETARRVLKDAMLNDTSIGAFEFTERNLWCLISTFPTIIFSFLLIPLILPWKLSRFFWTYLIPLIPIVATFDILASAFRTRTPEELQAMVKDLKRDNYHWHIGQEKSYFGFRMTYVVGLPEKKK